MARGGYGIGAALAVGLALTACGGGEQRREGRDTHERIEAEAQTPIPAAPPTRAVSPTPTPSAPAAAADATRYLGRWTGVEGMYLVVTDPPRGDVTLEMQYDLDNRGTFAGTVTADGIRFTRNGVAEVLRPGDGDATGLKWLAGKRDCLTVKPGEGYCRD